MGAPMCKEHAGLAAPMWMSKCAMRPEVCEWRPPAAPGLYVDLAPPSLSRGGSSVVRSGSLSARSCNDRPKDNLQRVQDMLHDRYHSHRSQSVFHAYRKMSFD